MGTLNGIIQFQNMDFFLLLRDDLDKIRETELFEIEEELDKEGEKLLLELPLELRKLYTLTQRTFLQARTSEIGAELSLTVKERLRIKKISERHFAYATLLERLFWFEARLLAGHWDLEEDDIDLRKGYQLVQLMDEE